MRLAACLTAACLLTSCASNLDVWNSAQQPVNGVPFRSAEVYVKQGMRDKLAKGGACAEVAFVQTVSLPTGALHYANVRPGALAKNGFTMKFAESGTLTELSMNSEPAGAETIKAAGEFLSTTLPFLGITAATATTVAVAGDLPACDAGEKGVRFERLSDYMSRQP